jgi:hypothetical protein
MHETSSVFAMFHVVKLREHKHTELNSKTLGSFLAVKDINHAQAGLQEYNFLFLLHGSTVLGKLWPPHISSCIPLCEVS